MQPSPVQLWEHKRYLILNWEVLGLALERLRRDVVASGFEPTTVVGIARGGLVPATFFANAFALHDLQVISIVRNTSHQRYSGRREPIVQWIAPETPLDGKRVLLVDDIAGDGGTLRHSLELLAARGAREVRTVVVVRNRNTRFEPDHFAVESNDWVVFPWEKPVERDAPTEPMTLPTEPQETLL